MTENQRTPDREQPEESRALPPEARQRPDTFVRATQPEARHQMERGDDTFNEPSFSKGDNAPTANQTGLPYTVEDYDQALETAPKGLFSNSPGVGKMLPPSANREMFLDNMMQIGHFESVDEAERWARAVFDALRVRAIDTDNARSTVFDDVIHTSEAPELQIKNMMWAEGFRNRYLWLVSHLKGWTQQDFYRQIATYGKTTEDDAWVAAAAFAFLGALKRATDAEVDLGELQEVWDRA